MLVHSIQKKDVGFLIKNCCSPFFCFNPLSLRAFSPLFSLIRFQKIKMSLRGTDTLILKRFYIIYLTLNK